MKLNKIFSSNMVFAHNLPVRIYGEGHGTAEISFAGVTKKVVSDSDSWLVEFPEMDYGGPYILEAVFENTTVLLKDIYIGNVYLFAGQSNMAFKMNESSTPDEFYEANNLLRFYATDRIEAGEPYNSNDGWLTCESERIGNFSALGYLTGYEIAVKKNIAVGIIGCYQGASVIESWVPKGSFEKLGINIPLSEKHPDHVNADFISWNQDGMLYSYALSQVIPFSLSGVVWYQGESDTSVAEGRLYGEELCELIRIWRKAFDREDLPFTVIQLADYNSRNDDGWKLVQKAQAEVSERLSFVKTVVSADVCESHEIHPKTKEKLALRIAEALI